jgi:hypothetical protein
MANTTMRNLHRLPSSPRELDDLIKKIVGDSESLTLAGATPTTEVPLFVQAARARAGNRRTAEELLDEYSARLRQSTYPTLDCLLPEDVQRITEDQLVSDEQRQHLSSCEPCRNLLSAAQRSAERRGALLKELELTKSIR